MEFTSYVAWKDYCDRQFGWRGPYKVSGQPLWQYVGLHSGTKAIWNDAEKKGMVFEPETEVV